MKKGALSVVIPARNEESRLPRCVQKLRDSAAIAGANLEIVVVENRSTDRTAEIARSLGATVVTSEAKNLSVIRNVGVRATTGDNVLTVDADSLVSRGLISRVLRSLEDPRTVGGGVLIFPERWSLGIIATGMLVGSLALFYRISGGAFFFRRHAFEAIGGFDESVLSAEDIDFARRLKRYARRDRRVFRNLLTAHIVTSCRKFDSFGDWYLVRHPLEASRLLKGDDRELADKVWYEYRER